MLGGAAVHFSLAASFFTEVRPVGPVGDDFGAERVRGAREPRRRSPTTSSGSPGGESFFWRGRYEFDLNVAHTEDTQLGVFAEFEPKLSDALAGRRHPLPRQHPARPAAPGPRPVRRRPLQRPGLDEPLDRDRQGLAAGGDRRGRLPGRQRRRDPPADRRVEPRPRRPRGDGAWGRARSSPSRASTARRCSRRTASSPCPASRSRTCATRPAPATASPAASSATSTASDGELDEASLRRAMGYGTVLASFNVEEFGTERVARAQPRGDRRALRGAARDDPVRRPAGGRRVAVPSPCSVAARQQAGRLNCDTGASCKQA